MAFSSPLAYRDLAPGKKGPVVLGLHGLASTGQGLHPTVAPLVDQGFRVLLPDLLGHGASPWPAGLPYDSADHLAALQAWTDLVVGAEPVWLVGYSLGALLALSWAARDPGRVRGVVVISTPLFVNSAEAHVYLSRDPMGWGIVHVPALTRRLCGRICGTEGPARRFCLTPQFQPFVSWTVFHAFGLGQRDAISPLEALPELKTRLSTGMADCWLHSWDSLSGTFQRCLVEQSVWSSLDLLRAAQIPLLFLHGAHDNLAPVQHVREAARVGAWKLQEYVGGTHALPLTHPRALSHAITAFLSDPLELDGTSGTTFASCKQ